MSLMEQFANPETFGNLSFGERMSGTGITALMGMGITFAILIILWVMIALLTKIIRGIQGNGKKEKAPAAAAAASAAAPAAAAAAPAAGGQSPLADSASGDQLIAVIAAAIAAAEGGNAAASNFVVKKIQRLAGPTTAWNMAGLNESFDSRRM